VTAIAAQSFTVSRFHLDPQIPNLVANQIKAAWAKNFLQVSGAIGWLLQPSTIKSLAFCNFYRRQLDSLIIDLVGRCS
jgi:hypothetical protein